MLYALLGGGIAAIAISIVLRHNAGARTWIGAAIVLGTAAYFYLTHGGTFDAIVAVAGNAAELIPLAAVGTFGAVMLVGGLLGGYLERVAPD